MSKKKIVVGMSGGVDSSITVLLLKNQGWQPIGVSLKLAHWDDPSNVLGENACCTTESLDIAKSVCQKLDVSYHQYDVTKEFKKEVINYFVKELKNKRTPNPCVMCNRHLKFLKLFEWAKKHGIEYVSTGHYAKVCLNTNTGEYELVSPKDKTKDQTYGLSLLPKEWLKKLILPLGDITKKEVYDIAKKEGFDIFLKRKQSQDLCFVSTKAFPKFLRQEVGEEKGDIVDDKNNILGKHNGLHFYTIGQRKGLGLAEKYYVKNINVKTNRLIVTKDKESIGQKKVVMEPFHFISGKAPKEKLRVEAKVRYSQALAKATLYPPEGNRIEIIFDNNQNYIAPGQFCVFYIGDVCIGCGVICQPSLDKKS